MLKSSNFKIPMRYCCLLFLLLACGKLFSQSSLREKLYLHTDKNEYVLGDTIWFKTYLVDAFSQLPVIRSGIEYVELIDEDKKTILRIALHSFVGTGFGDIALDTAFAPGNYILRAYTNWMRNFGDSLFFQKQLTIGGARTDDWLVTGAPPVVKENAKGYDIFIVYQFKEKNLEPLHNRPVSFFITDEAGKIMQTGKLQTDYQGKLEAKFPLTKEQAGSPVFARIGTGKKDIKKIIPLFSGKNIDLQFLPESGHLVAGLSNTVGFKAIAEGGMGYDSKGVIKDNTEMEIISFQSLYKGMGSFNFIPEPGKTYTAVLQNGQQVPLPKPEQEGIVMHISQNNKDTAIRLQLQATPAFTGKEYLLRVDAKGYTVYKEKIMVKPDGAILKFPKSIFPAGVARFVLQNEKGQLLSERAVFINNNQHQLDIQLHTPQQGYHPRDSVPVSITIKNNEDKPAMGSFSFAVTDDSQVRKDINADQNILSYLLLQSELRGAIETPGYYFSKWSMANSQEASDSVAQKQMRSLDALMLTQGFVRYDWDTATFKYEAEPEFVVKGKVNNMLNKSAKNASITLLGNGPGVHFIRDTISDSKGEFTFTDLPAFDTITLIALSRSKIGNRFGLDVKLQQHLLPDAAHLPELNGFNHPEIDSGLLKRLQNNQLYDQAYFKQKGMLPNVTVKSSIRNSGVFGYEELSQTVGPDEIKPGISKNLLALLFEKVKGFGIRQQGEGTGGTNFVIGNRLAMIYIDGMPMDLGVFDGNGLELLERRLAFLRTYFGYDIKGIEVFKPINSFRTQGEQERSVREAMTVPGQNTSADEKGRNRLQGGSELSGQKQISWRHDRIDEMLRSAVQDLRIEVTTYAHWGPYKHATMAQEYLYPQPFSYGKTFYAPRYNASYINDSLPDYRSTIYWSPLVVTNEKGAAQVSFYAADLPPSNSGKPVTYTLWIEGMDLEGNVGVKTEKIEVK